MGAKIIIAAATLVLAGCAPAPHSETPAPVNRVGTASGTTVDRVVDEEMGVVCYVSDGAYSGGISCLPLPKGES